MIKLLHKLFKKKDDGLPRTLKVDIHSHLIPGIDDGAKTTYESIKMIKALKQIGYEKLITTPHIMSHRYKNSAQDIKERLNYLKDALADHDVEIEIEAASEYYLDDHFLSLLGRGELLSFGDGYILFEMSYTSAPKDLREIILDIEATGLKPVLAHPERYLFMHDSFEEYEALKELDVYFQLNLNSLAGQYSKRVQQTAFKLIDNGWIDFLGSDLHKLTQTQTLQKVISSGHMQTIFQKNRILNDTLL